MRFCVLGSGSKGNATYVEAGGARILIDCGFSGKEVERRLAEIQVDPAELSAILVTHEHSDHIRGVPIFSRRFQLPVYVGRLTVQAAGKGLENLYEWREISTGTTFSVAGLTVHPFSLSHDAADPMGFVMTCQGISLGYCTDTGAISRLMKHRLAGCHGLILEFNHDPALLKNGTYPPSLKQRVRSKSGHLANEEAAGFLNELIHAGLQHVVLAHISESNNHPDLINLTVNDLLEQYRRQQRGEPLFRITLACQDRVGEMLTLVGGDFPAGQG